VRPELAPACAAPLPSPVGEAQLPRLASSTGADSTPPSSSMSPPRNSDQLAQILRELPEPLRNALGEIPLPLWIVDARGQIRWLNAQASGRFDARVGARFQQLVDEDSVVEVESVQICDADEVIGELAFVCTASERVGVRQRRRKPRLTPRQHQVLELLAQGRSTEEIAQALQISEQTVRNHIRHLLAELNVRTRLAAVVAAFRNGWL
jgi:DNA-binding CsgD family transcriptional regulator